MLTGHWRARAIHAARPGIADILSGGPLPAEEVARLLVADPDAIARFVRFLSHIGVLRVDSSLRYGIGTIGGLLRIDNPFHDVVRLYGEEFHHAWDNLLPARVVIEPALADWLTLCPVDFFVEVPAGHDVYLLARVLRDWINEGYVRILRVCRQACGPAAVILSSSACCPTSTQSPWPLRGTCRCSLSPAAGNAPAPSTPSCYSWLGFTSARFTRSRWT